MEIMDKVSKLVKPSTPTSSALRNYNLSVFDEQLSNTNVPLTLYYSSLEREQNDIQTNNIFDHLEISLSRALTNFYPLAGRYTRGASFIDCSDQGALYIQAKVTFQLSEFLCLKQELKLNLLQDFIPCDVLKAGEANDPLLSIKVTTFECGGVAIGMCISHKFADMATFSTFIDNWATRSREILGNGFELELEKYTHVVSSSAHLFPKIDILNDGIDRSSSSYGRVPKLDLRVFSFKGSAIKKLREEVMAEDNIIISHRPSKVQLITALLWKAFVDIDRANGQLKVSVLSQAVNLRNIAVLENFCGNFVSLAYSRIEFTEVISFQVLLKLLQDSVNKTKHNFAKALSHPEPDHEVLLKPLKERFDRDVKVYVFSSWCRFSFHTVDFGWGKPVWRSMTNVKIPNRVCLMDDQEGDGVEVWVHLDKKEMCKLEQDPNIRAYMNA